MALEKQDYTLGKGEVWFSRFKTGTQEPEGYRWIGNTTEFNMNFASDQLEHYASYQGVKELDDSVDLQVNRSGSMTTDHISPENIALFFFGSASALTIAAATVSAEAINDIVAGRAYQLGATAANPTGHRAVGSVIAKKGATTLVLNTDYTLDADLGWITFLKGGAVVDGDDVTVDYSVPASTRSRIISGSTSVEGSIKFIARNPKGTNKDYLLPWAKISPNGDYNLISDEWQTIPFSLKIMKRTDREALYVETRAVTA